SCKHESWTNIAKYLVEDVPTLLSSKDVKDVKDVLSIVFNSSPSKFLEFIKWVAEVRRLEDGDQSLSSEEKQRLATKEEILKQVQEIRLYKHVKDFIFDEKSCLCNETCLTDIAEGLCCQAAQVFEGNTRSLSQNGFCCQESSAVKTNGDKPVTVVSRTVMNGMGKQQLDVLIPSSSSCIAMHPTSSDVLTALLLALPPETWFSIKDENLLHDISGLVSIDNLPTLLQEEIMHLRGQLYILKRCNNDETEKDFGAPLV
ncbi:glutathione gamma-glutamylcysteinyltransferase 1-like protein, partial [Tanacetum coccineum]